jgi:hypothetical protein
MVSCWHGLNRFFQFRESIEKQVAENTIFGGGFRLPTPINNPLIGFCDRDESIGAAPDSITSDMVS